MSNNPWEVPRHDNPLTHATPNPTPDYQHVPLGGGASGDGQGWSAAPSGTPGWTPGAQSLENLPNTGVGGFVSRTALGYKSMWLSVLLSIVSGPFGLFYMGFLTGLAALLTVSTVVPFLVNLMPALRDVAIPIAWCFTVPWAIVATRRHNARRG